MKADLAHEAAAVPVLDPARRFGGIDRLYGAGSVAALARGHACVIGIGGVGSWAAEALARSGVGALTLIDLDQVAESNINRQVHALDATLGQAKVDAMAARIASFNPLCVVHVVDDFLTADNAAALLQGFDVVIDAIDNVAAKVAIAVICRSRRLPLVMAGGAGGKLDPARLGVDDLARTIQDPLLAKVRARLRKEHGFSREPGKSFGIEAVFSDETLRHVGAGRETAVCDTGITDTPPRSAGVHGLACAGYGSSMMMTASAGLLCAQRALVHLLRAGSAAAIGKEIQS